MTKSLMNIDNFVPFIEGLDHPEGVTWGPDGYVYAGGEAGQIYRVNLDDGTSTEIGNTGGFVLGLCLDEGRNVYACDLEKPAVMRITPAGKVSTYSEGAPTRSMKTPNYPVFDAAGNLYVSDSGGWKESNGCIFRVRPNGETEVVSDEALNFANGMALSADGAELYVVLSLAPGVGKVQLRGDGSVGPMQHVVTLERTVPDGVAFDVEGNLYIACYTPDRIYRLTPDGELDIVVEDWESTVLSSPTNIAFGGPDLSTLIVASLARWHLTKAQMPVPGIRGAVSQTRIRLRSAVLAAHNVLPLDPQDWIDRNQRLGLSRGTVRGGRMLEVAQKKRRENGGLRDECIDGGRSFFSSRSPSASQTLTISRCYPERGRLSEQETAREVGRR